MACFNKWDIGQCGCACDLSFQVFGCRGAETGYNVGSGVTVEWRSGGSTIYSADTDSSGIATVSGVAGNYDIRVTDNRTPSRWETFTSGSISFSCGATVQGSLTTPKSGYHCSDCCGDPLADTLYDTDPNGTWTLAYDGSNVNGAGWYGCGTKTSMASVVTALAAGVCTPTTGTANVPYVIKLPARVAGVGPCEIRTYWGHYLAPGAQRTTSTSTCSAGAMDYNAGIPGTCIGSIGQATAAATPTTTCPPALSLSASLPSTGTSGVANPGSGTHTITE